MISSTISILRRQLKSYPIPTAFLMIGFVISFLIISFGTSSFVQLKEMVESRNDNAPPHGISVSVAVGTERFDLNQVLTLFERVEDKNTGMIFTSLSGVLDEAPADHKISLRAEFFNKNLKWKYMITEGRYYQESELKKGEKVALIGKNLQRYAAKQGTQDFIVVSGQKFAVIGVLGKENEKTNWDDTVVLPVYSLPKVVVDSLETSGVLGFILHNENKLPMGELAFLESGLKKTYPNSQISAQEIQKNVDVISLALSNPEFTQVLSLLVYVLALINSINLTSFWIDQRKYEIGIRKAFGHTNFNIIKLLLIEMLIIISVSGIISLLLHLAIGSFVSSISNVNNQIYFENILVAVVFVAITTLLTTIIPALKCIKLQPIEAMKK